MHEGWLGPVDEPPSLPESIPIPEVDSTPIHPPTEARTDNPAAATENPDITKSESENKPEEEKKEEEKKKPYPPPAYLALDKYSSATLSPHTPSNFEPARPIHQQHLLGFLKTPQRIYHFLTRRQLADQIGRETAAIVLAASRPYQQGSSFLASSDFSSEADSIAAKAPESDASPSSDVPSLPNQNAWEQQSLLINEEPTWHKSTRKPRKEDDTSEPIWTEGVVVDERIGSRMRKFELDPEEEARANRLASGVEKPNVKEPLDLTQEKVIVGNLDDD